VEIEVVSYKEILRLSREKQNLLTVRTNDFQAGFIIGALSVYCKVYVAQNGGVYYAVTESNLCLLDFFAEEFGYVPPGNPGGFVKAEITPNTLNLEFAV